MRLLARPWLPAFAAAALTFLATTAITGGQGAGGLLAATLTFASFSVIVGLGQMAVITLGPGNVDLSVPAVMTLAGTLSLKLMDGEAGTGALGLAVALAIGLGAGAANHALILALRIPPIIATLSASFVFQSIAIWSNRGLRVKPPEALAAFSTGSTLGAPNVALVAVGLAVAGWVLIERSAHGRRLSAMGQNGRAARLAGVPVEAVRAITYAMSGLMAGLAGFLLSCFSGGAALNMGAEFLLMSIAVVVIGGSSIAGGRSNVPGLWGAAAFMFLLVSMLNSYGLGAGVSDLLTGIIIIAVVTVASGGPAERR